VQPDRQGRALLYFRYKGVYQRLPDDPESPEFYARYSALLAGVKMSAQAPAEGTMAAVIVDYKRSAGYQRLTPKTRRDYDRHLARFAPFGGWHVSQFKRRHIKEIQKPLNKTPRTAKYFAQVCSLLFAHAVDELELIEVNPAARLKRLDKVEAYKAWERSRVCDV